MEILLSHLRSSEHTILAIETICGEVFGSFTSSPWHHKGNNYYGSGESFLWRMKENRMNAHQTVQNLTRDESDIEVFEWSGKNRNIQLCNPKKLIVGGGEANSDIDSRLRGEKEDKKKTTEVWDFGLALNSDLSRGTSGKCVTFNSPGLSKNGCTFDILNLEVWVLTPVTDASQAEKLELARQFVFSNMQTS